MLNNGAAGMPNFRACREGLLTRIARHVPGLTKQQCQTQAGVVKVMMNPLLFE